METESFHPSDFLKFSKRLLKENELEREPLFRTIVNRCYLAAYMSAKRVLIGRNFSYENNFSDYRKVESDLRASFRKNGRFMQEHLSLLRSSRGDVDYEYPFKGFLDRQYVDHKLYLTDKILEMLNTSM